MSHGFKAKCLSQIEIPEALRKEFRDELFYWDDLGNHDKIFAKPKYVNLGNSLLSVDLHYIFNLNIIIKSNEFFSLIFETQNHILIHMEAEETIFT